MDTWTDVRVIYCPCVRILSSRYLLLQELAVSCGSLKASPSSLAVFEVFILGNLRRLAYAEVAMCGYLRK